MLTGVFLHDLKKDSMREQAEETFPEHRKRRKGDTKRSDRQKQERDPALSAGTNCLLGQVVRDPSHD